MTDPADRTEKAPRCNLHVHSTFSDGTMSPERVVAAARAGGLSGVGFAEHFVSSKLPYGMSLRARDIADYGRRLKRLRRESGGSPAVYAGLEIAFVVLATDLTSLGIGSSVDLTRHLDFLLFEYVSDPLWGGMDLVELLKIRPLIGKPVGLAHCDIDRIFSARIDPGKLAEILGENGIFVELCPSSRNSRARDHHTEKPEGPIPYYRVDSPYLKEFFRVAADAGVMFSIGTDAHNSPDEVTGIDDAVQFVYENGLEERLIDLDAQPKR